LNLAHGAHGWTLAAASARLLSEQIAGKASSLPGEWVNPQRFQS
jgi:glycine/D-amino acid oxidase-like deaminating enzyme